jgi:hypothetical protein
VNEKSTEISDGAQEKDQFPSGFIVEDSSVEELLARVIKLERRNKVVIYTFTLFLTLALIGLGGEILNQTIIVQQKLMESKELTLIDNDGNARLFIRMFSRVPVIQVLDSNGKPRISMGLRFDDTPFIDMSDRKGNTRTTLEITTDDSPALSMFNEKGDTTFTIN